MQLLLYLFVVRSLLSDTETFPAGMLYAPVVNPVVKSDVRLDDHTLHQKVANGMVLTGMLIDDVEILKKIDKSKIHSIKINDKNLIINYWGCYFDEYKLI